jgi:hypothetical protein
MEQITKFDDKCVIIRIRQKSIGIRGSLYEAARRCWRTVLAKAEDADYVLVLVGDNLKVAGVFKPDRWYYLEDDFCEKNMKECEKLGTKTERCKKNRRIAFEGKELTDDVKYLNKLIPKECSPGETHVSFAY